MKRSGVVEWLSMKRIEMLVLLTLFLIPGGCITGTNMIAKDTKPPLVTKSNMAALVIIQSASFGGGYIINNYLDGKRIGQTQYKSYFITDVKPGKHYLTSEADNKDTARINFEPGRIYFLQQGIYPGWNATTRFSPMTLEEAKLEIQEAVYYVYDSGKPGKDMSEKDREEEVAAFEKENKEDPERYRDILNYKGY